MKHLLKYTTLCLLAAGSLGFTACSSSDDDDTLTSTAGSIGPSAWTVRSSELTSRSRHSAT